MNRLHLFSLLRLLCISCVILHGMGEAVRAKPPVVQQLFPAGAAVGASSVIHATGEIDPWPPAAVVSFPAGLQVTALAEQGKLQLDVPAEAAPGVYLIRLVQADGVSAWRPLVVARAADVLESEPNNAPDQAQHVDLPAAVVHGKLAGRADVDMVAVDLEAGQTLIASLQANQLLRSPMDGVLQLCDDRGFVLAQNDDEIGLDSQLAFQVPRAGRYLVRVFAFPEQPDSTIGLSSGDNYIYRLSITREAFVDHVLPLAVQRNVEQSLHMIGWNLNDASPLSILAAGEAVDVAVPLAHAGHVLRLPVVDMPSLIEPEDGAAGDGSLLPVPSVVSGRIAAPGEVDSYRFQASGDEKLMLNVESRGLNFALDPVLRVLDASGKKLSEADDVRDDRDPQLEFTVPAEGGTYEVQVRDLHGHGGLRYAYRLTIDAARSTLVASPAADAFTAARGTTIDVPINLQRRDGFAEVVQFVAEDLPSGCTFTCEESPDKGPLSKRVTGKLQVDCEPGQYQFRLIAKSPTDAFAPVAARLSIAGVSYDTTWLTVTPP